MQVYISTNKEQPANCFETTEEKRRVRALVAALNIDSTLEVAKDVFLIHQDRPSIVVDKEKSCLLHHTTISNVVKSAFDSGLVKPGMHEQNDNGLYAPVFKVLLNDSITEKLPKILKILGFTDTEVQGKEILESKLNFLHHCLTPEGLKEEKVTKSEWAKLNEFTKLQEASDGPFGDKYLSALRTLRDKLLVS